MLANHGIRTPSDLRLRSSGIPETLAALRRTNPVAGIRHRAGPRRRDVLRRRVAPGIEANPLVGWYLSAFGPAVGFTVAKLFAVTCGSVLYFTARYRWVAILTLVYLIFAVGPWVGLLSNSV
jgi:hypothetical protein